MATVVPAPRQPDLGFDIIAAALLKKSDQQHESQLRQLLQEREQKHEKYLKQTLNEQEAAHRDYLIQAAESERQQSLLYQAHADYYSAQAKKQGMMFGDVTEINKAMTALDSLAQILKSQSEDPTRSTEERTRFAQQYNDVRQQQAAIFNVDIPAVSTNPLLAQTQLEDLNKLLDQVSSFGAADYKVGNDILPTDTARLFLTNTLSQIDPQTGSYLSPGAFELAKFGAGMFSKGEGDYFSGAELLDLYEYQAPGWFASLLGEDAEANSMNMSLGDAVRSGVVDQFLASPSNIAESGKTLSMYEAILRDVKDKNDAPSRTLKAILLRNFSTRPTAAPKRSEPTQTEPEQSAYDRTNPMSGVNF